MLESRILKVVCPKKGKCLLKTWFHTKGLRIILVQNRERGEYWITYRSQQAHRSPNSRIVTNTSATCVYPGSFSWRATQKARKQEAPSRIINISE